MTRTETIDDQASSPAKAASVTGRFPGMWAREAADDPGVDLADVPFEVCDIEVCTARTQVRVANALRTWPTLDAAMRTGDVPYAKARTLVPHLSDDNVDDLVQIATVTPAGRLGAAIAAWVHRHEDDEVIAVRNLVDNSGPITAVS